jgi:hypothetical protein
MSPSLLIPNKVKFISFSMWTNTIAYAWIAFCSVYLLLQVDFTTAFSTKPTLQCLRQFQTSRAPCLHLINIKSFKPEEKASSSSSPLLANEAISTPFIDSSRHGFLHHASMRVLATAAFWINPFPPNPPVAYAKSYSANARNMERLNAGDASGGSIYDNNPSSIAARKRRAMTGCKIPSARQEAAQVVLGIDSLSEKDCNLRVLQQAGEEKVGEFMLQAMRNLDCPTCPYGVQPNR